MVGNDLFLITFLSILKNDIILSLLKIINHEVFNGRKRSSS